MASVAIQGEISWETDDSPGKFVCYSLLMTVVHRITAWFGLDETLKLFMLLLMPLPLHQGFILYLSYPNLWLLRQFHCAPPS